MKTLGQIGYESIETKEKRLSFKWDELRDSIKTGWEKAMETVVKLNNSKVHYNIGHLAYIAFTTFQDPDNLDGIVACNAWFSLSEEGRKDWETAVAKVLKHRKL